MARGFLSGVLWGGLVGVGVSGAASVLAPPPAAPELAAVAPDATVTPTNAAQVNETTASTQDAPLAARPVPEPIASEGADTIAALDGDAAQTAAPDALQAPEALATPQAAEGGTGVTIGGDAPVLPNPQALAPMAPQDVDALAIDTQSAEAPVVAAPEASADVTQGTRGTQGTQDPARSSTDVLASEDAETGAEPQAPAQEGAVQEGAVQDNGSAAETAQTDENTQAQIAATEEAAEPQSTDVQQENMSQDAELQDADAQEAETQEAENQDADTQETVVAALPAEDTTAPGAPQDASPRVTPVDPPAVVTAPEQDAPSEASDNGTTVSTRVQVAQGASARPRIGQSVGSLTDRDTEITIRRPGSASLGEPDDGVAETVASDADAQADDDPRPIRRFAQTFEPETGKPLMAIVLIDDGSSPVTGTAGITALSGFPYALTFAVDSALPDAKQRMETYRNEGFEVLAMVDLPAGAQASDAETTFGVVLSQMTDVVGVLEGTKSGLQGSRDVFDQVTSILLQTGHGLLAQGKGLNTLPKLARKKGVPADPVFRDFDSKGQSAAVIRRFLDQAAFKAGQEGAVVMLGRLRPDTVSALLLWGLQDRAGKVSLSPISTVLLREE